MTNTHPTPPKEKKINKKTPHRLEIRFTEAEWIEVLGAQCQQGLVGSWREWEERKKRRLPGHLGSRVLQQPLPPGSVEQVAQPLAREVVCRACAGVAARAQCPGQRGCGAGTSAHINVSAEIK